MSDSERTFGEREASFRLLFASNPLPMWVYDVATLRFLEVNAAALDHYGYTRDEFLRMRIADIRPPEDLPRLETAVAEFVAKLGGGIRRHQETWRHRLKDGRIRDVEIASQLIDFDGRPAGLVVATDITELKQAREALARNTERLNILHEIDRAILAAETPEAIAEAALLRLRDLLGLPRTIVSMFDLADGQAEWLAAVGRRRTRLGPGIRFPLALMGDLDALRRSEVQVIDVDAQPSGPEVDALLASGVHVYRVVPMIAGGELIGGLSFGGSSEEISPGQVAIAQEVAAQMAIAITQARLYERVKRQAEELEQRVRERTLALSAANAQLQQEIAERRRAEAEAERANRAKSEFLSRMSHELRTPLNVILGFGQLLELGAETADDRESVEQILKAGRHLLDLINEVLDIARIEAGHLPLSPEPVRVAELIGESLDLVRPLAADLRVALEAEPPAACDHYVLADRQRLKQILLNLCSNAIKYNRAGGRVTVRCAPYGERLRVTVADTGQGIPPDRLGRLFEPFERLGAEQTAVEGTGLGLALSKSLAEAMGGALGVASAIGQGSTFWVELPTTPGPTDEPDGPDGGGAGLLATEAGAPDRTVLYIEDNLANFRLIERLLANRPAVRLLAAMQGRLGLELARKHGPDLILLDVHLPDMDGSEILRRLQADEATREIPVVVVSADATPGRIRHLREAGARAYLAKPIDVREALEVIDALLDERDN